MDYIEQIKNFWRCHEQEAFSANEIALYFYLLEVNNKLSWKNSFKRNNFKIRADLLISNPTLFRTRKNLKQRELIDFSAINGSSNVTYTLKKSYKLTNEVVFTEDKPNKNPPNSLLVAFPNEGKPNLNKTPLKSTPVDVSVGSSYLPTVERKSWAEIEKQKETSLDHSLPLDCFKEGIYYQNHLIRFDEFRVVFLKNSAHKTSIISRSSGRCERST